MSDRGTRARCRHMNGYGSHTYSWMNAAGERFWVKYHFKTDQGIENFTQAEADAMAGRGPRLPPPRPARGDRARRPPEWRLRDADHALRGRARTTASTRST